MCGIYCAKRIGKPFPRMGAEISDIPCNVYDVEGTKEN